MVRSLNSEVRLKLGQHLTLLRSTGQLANLPKETFSQT
jgi:hypothetical protein